MHFQPGQAKLVRCVRGAIFDVIVDIRVGSPTFGQWEGYELNDETHHQLFVPDGFAHGFCVLSELADVIYKVTSYYDPATEGGFRFDDPGGRDRVAVAARAADRVGARHRRSADAGRDLTDVAAVYATPRSITRRCASVSQSTRTSSARSPTSRWRR